MKPTPLQLEIQQRADKTLSFGCYFKVLDDERIKIFCYEENGLLRDIRSEFFDEGNIDMVIGHPMNWGRLCYLNEIHTEHTRERNDIQDYAMSHPVIYQQTVLERPIELQELVLSFLKTLGQL